MTPKYQTVRILRFRASELNRREESTIAHIEKFGCSILHVKDCHKETDRPLFSYTIGVFDTSGQPEIISVGLKEDLTHDMLNEAVRRLRAGVDLSVGRHRELIGEVECEFRPVDPKWVNHLMGWARWYNSGQQFPVLQVVYPDLQNRFPEDEGFNEYFAQPLLQPGAPMRRIEEDFWASNDPESSLSDWKFSDPPHTGVYLSETVHSGVEAINFVSHDLEDGAWQLLGDSMSDGGGPVIVCFHHPIDKDPTLKELFDLPLGWYAKRTKPGEPWMRYQHEPEDPSEDQ